MSGKVIPDETVKQVIEMAIHGSGYGRPPQHSRFRKGQSGNPKGRPRKAGGQPSPAALAEGSHAAITSRVLNEPVVVMRNGRKRKIAKAEAVQRNMEKLAFAGGYNASRNLQHALKDDEERHAHEIAKDHAWWDNYLGRRAADLGATSARGLPPSQFWIEPEDIIFWPNRFVEVRGPRNRQEVKDFELLASLLRIRMVEWSGRLFLGRQDREHEELEVYAIHLLARTFPKRLARDCQAFWESLSAVPVLWTREYELKRLEAWQSVGLKPPRKLQEPITLSLSPAALKQLKDVTASTREHMASLDALFVKRRRYRAKKAKGT